MKDDIDFESLYKTLFDEEVTSKKPILGIIDSDNIISKILALGLITVAIVAYLLHISGDGVDVDVLLNVMYIFFILPIWILEALFNRHNNKKYIIKGDIVNPLVLGINKSFKYNPFRYIPENIFKTSKIFSKRFSSYSGNDLIMGKLDDNYILFSDLLVQNFYKNIFHGHFIVTQFNKNFSGHTVVTTDYAQTILGDVLGGFMQAATSGKDLIRMDNPDFEEAFVVHGTDSIEAHYILSSSMMEYILNYQKKVNRLIEISFVNNAVFIAIPYGKDHFESIDSFVGRDKSEIEEIFNEEFLKPLELATGIIEELKLNQKLWSKQNEGI